MFRSLSLARRSFPRALPSSRSFASRRSSPLPSNGRFPEQEQDSPDEPIEWGNVYVITVRALQFIAVPVISFYSIFYHDFGPYPHCFTSIREWKSDMEKSLFAPPKPPHVEEASTT